MKSKRIEFRANEHEAAQWEALAEARGMGISDLVRLVLNNEVAREPNRKRAISANLEPGVTTQRTQPKKKT